MKQVLILITMLIGWASCAFAQADLKEDNIIRGSWEGPDAPNAPKYIIGGGLDRGMSILEILQAEFGPNEKINRLSSKSADYKDMSKFQLVVDEKGKVLDCSMVKSTNRDKDEKILNCLSEKNFKEEVSTVDGKPCKSVLMLSIGYHKNGDIDVKHEGYPLIPLPDTGKDEATTAPTGSQK